MIRTYQYRIYPNKKTTKILNYTIELCRQLYNAALTERKEAYRSSQISLNYYSQTKELPATKLENPELNDVYSQVLCDVVKRLDNAYNLFFNRVKSKNRMGKKAGFPRHKSRDNYNSITYPQSGFKLIHKSKSTNKGILQLSKIGDIKTIISREITDGDIKTCTVKRNKIGQWYVDLTVEFPDAVKIPLEQIKEEEIIGVDVGINKLAVLSNGVEIENPKLIAKYEKGIKTLQTLLSKSKKHSYNRAKIRKKLAKKQLKLANTRKDSLHKESNQIVKSGNIIVFEDLNVQGMVQNHNLAKSISDASWSKLMDMCDYKAENAGKCTQFVDPRDTSQLCSRCGAAVKKDLSIRIHSCNNCGLTIDRDLNAALNIRERYMRLAWNSVKMPVDAPTTAHSIEQVGAMKQEETSS
ncbi:MAG: transposase [Candidatus Thermoplasmatota archaeon]|nr:transposase [Candidatus Thermoplasmatota archaeon]